MNTDDVLSAAIRDKQCLTGLYDNVVRHFAPHALGTTSDGTPAVFVFQYAGESSGGLPRGGDWRCFRVDGLSAVRANGERWRTRSNYSLQHQHCLALIDLAVPISS